MLKDIAYHALADLIYRGALFAHTELAGYPFVFKTLSEVEYNYIKIKAGSPDRLDYNVRFNLIYLAHSVFMVNGENVLLGNREEKLSLLTKFFQAIPNILCDKIIEEVTGLKADFSEIDKFVEGFCYTQQSRQKWELLDNRQVNDDHFTGIPGTKTIGLNSFQENWLQINRALDQEEAYNQELSLALIVASASNPKGSRKMRAQHDSSLQKSKDKRKKIAKEGFGYKTSWKEGGWSAPTDTAEELVAELERQMSGKKDKHDLVISNYLEGLKNASESFKLEEQQKMQESVDRHKDEPMITGTQRVLTNEEVKAMMASRSDVSVKVLPSEEADTAEQQDHFYKKIGTNILGPKQK